MTQLELTSLRNIHLLGYPGFPFSAQKKPERLRLLKKWQDEGLVTYVKGCITLTKLGIEQSLPSVKPTDNGKD